MHTSPGGPKRVKLLTGVQTGQSQWINVQGYSNLTVYFKTTGNPGAGTCLIEEADFDDSTSPGVATTSAIVTVDIDVSVGTDGQYAYHLASGRAYSYIRTRIGTDVTVATLDTVLVVN